MTDTAAMTPEPPMISLTRARTVDVRPLITEQVTGTLEQMEALATNPNTRAILDARRVGAGHYTATIIRADVEPYQPTSQPRIRIEGGRRYATILGLLFGIPGALFGAGWLAYTLWGNQINHAFGAFLAVAATFLSAAAIGSIVIATKSGGCPGLHCPGCSHH